MLSDRLKVIWILARVSVFALGLAATILFVPLFLLVSAVLYAATWGSDEPLKMACASDSIFTSVLIEKFVELCALPRI